MADLSWNMDFRELDPSEFLRAPREGVVTVAGMFSAAIEERYLALTDEFIGVSDRFPYVIPLYEEPHQDFAWLQTTNPLAGLAWWRRLRIYARVLNRSFLPRSIEFEGAETLKTIANGGWDDRVGYIWLPQTNTVSRSYPREIYRLDAPGVEGERARFVAHVTRLNTVSGLLFNDPWYGLPASDIEFGWALKTNDQYIATPADQVKLSGRIFERREGAWMPSTALEPDIVEEVYDPTTPPAGVSTQVLGGAVAELAFFRTDYQTEVRLVTDTHPGDYITGTWLNELRDAINEWVWSGINVDASTEWQYYNFDDAPWPRPDGGALDYRRLTPLPYAEGEDLERLLGNQLINPEGQNRLIEYWAKRTGGNWFKFDEQGPTAAEAGLGMSTEDNTITSIAVILKWDVEGGFAYTANT